MKWMRRTLRPAAVCLLAALVLLGASSCDVGDDYERVFHDDERPIEELPWPANDSPLPRCSVPFGEERAREVAAPTGDVLLTPSAPLQPVGVEERIEVEVRVSGTEERDTSAAGEWVLDAGPDVAVAELGAVQRGLASAVVVFHKEGLHTLSAVFADGTHERTGSAEVIAYPPQLPVFQVTVEPNDLDEILDHPDERIKIPGVLTVEGESYETTMRIHGGSSRYYPKQSFRFDLGAGLALPDTHDHIILRAEWNDKTMLRNFLGLETIRDATWLHTPRAELVHLRVNQRYYGAMWRVERVGGDFLRTRGLNHETAILYEADPPLECSIPGGNLTPLSSEEEYRCVYDLKKGETDYADLRELIEWTLLLPEGDFEAIANDEINVNDALVYWAVMAVIQNHDHIRKNYYLYRDPDRDDDRWIIIPWDLELTFGHLWTEENDVLDEGIYTDEPLDFGAHPELGFWNEMLSRLYGVDDYRERFHELVGHILQTTFNADFIDERIDNVLCRGMADILADSRKRATNEEYLERVEEIRTFVEARRARIQNEDL